MHIPIPYSIEVLMILQDFELGNFIFIHVVASLHLQKKFKKDCIIVFRVVKFSHLPKECDLNEISEKVF